MYCCLYVVIVVDDMMNFRRLEMQMLEHNNYLIAYYCVLYYLRNYVMSTMVDEQLQGKQMV